jgi:hypothetical protein
MSISKNTSLNIEPHPDLLFGLKANRDIAKGELIWKESPVCHTDVLGQFKAFSDIDEILLKKIKNPTRLTKLVIKFLSLPTTRQTKFFDDHFDTTDDIVSEPRKTSPLSPRSKRNSKRLSLSKRDRNSPMTNRKKKTSSEKIQIDQYTIRKIAKHTKHTKAHVKKAYEACMYNAMTTLSPGHSLLNDVCLFDVASFINHRCINFNADWFINPRTFHIHIIAKKDIQKDDWITITYNPGASIFDKEIRSKDLGFQCKCEDCKLNIEGQKDGIFRSDDRPFTRKHIDCCQLVQRFTQERDQKRREITLNLIIDKHEEELQTHYLASYLLFEHLYILTNQSMIDVISKNQAGSNIGFSLIHDRTKVLFKALIGLSKLVDLDDYYQCMILDRFVLGFIHVTHEQIFLNQAAKMYISYTTHINRMFQFEQAEKAPPLLRCMMYFSEKVKEAFRFSDQLS